MSVGYQNLEELFEDLNFSKEYRDDVKEDCFPYGDPFRKALQFIMDNDNTVGVSSFNLKNAKESTYPLNIVDEDKPLKPSYYGYDLKKRINSEGDVVFERIIPRNGDTLNGLQVSALEGSLKKVELLIGHTPQELSFTKTGDFYTINTGRIPLISLQWTQVSLRFTVDSPNKVIKECHTRYEAYVKPKHVEMGEEENEEIVYEEVPRVVKIDTYPPEYVTYIGDVITELPDYSSEIVLRAKYEYVRTKLRTKLAQGCFRWKIDDVPYINYSGMAKME